MQAHQNTLPADLLGKPHIVLMGGQTLPNIIAARELRARSVRIICSPQTESLIPGFVAACEALGIPADHAPVCASAWSLDGALKSLQSAPASLWQDAVLNYTGGTKPMSAAAMLAAFDQKIPQFYVDGSSIWLTDQHVGIPISTRLGVSDLLIANLIPRVNAFAPNPTAFTHRLSEAPTLNARRISRAIAGRLDGYRNQLVRLKAADAGTVAPEHRDKLLQWLGLTDINPAEVPRLGALLRGQWLEIWAYDFLCQHQVKLGISDVQWSVSIQRPVKPEASEETDLDVALTRDNKLAFLSCKAAASDELFDETFEVAERRRRLGGRRGMGGLLHWHEVTENPKAPANKHQRRAMEAAKFATPPISIFDGKCLRDRNWFLARLQKELFSETAVD